MSLKIRLSRGGAKKRPYYRVVVADSRAPRDGRFIERVGSYDPMLPKDSEERVKLSVGRLRHLRAIVAGSNARDATGIHRAVLPVEVELDIPVPHPAAQHGLDQADLFIRD